MKIKTTFNAGPLPRALFTFLFAVAATVMVAGSYAAPVDLFETDYYSGTIYRFTPDGTRSIFASGLSNPIGLACDSAGNFFAADASGTIYKFTPDGTRSTFASGLNNPFGLAFDSAGNLFEADEGSGTIYKFAPDGTRSTFASGLSGPFALAFDGAGNLFETDNGTSSINKFTPDGTRTTFATGLNYPYGLACDSAGNLFEADFLSGTIYKFTPEGTRSTFASGLSGPIGLIFDSAGNLFEVDQYTNSINEFTPGGTRITFASEPSNGGEFLAFGRICGTWTQLGPTGGPPGVRILHSAVFNPTNNRMIVFGGMNGPGTLVCSPLFNDVWVLANADGLGGPSTWTQLSPTGGPPSARYGHHAVYDAVNNRMMMFAGDPVCGGWVDDFWVLTNADGTGGTPDWTQLSPTGGPSHFGFQASAVYDPVTNRVVVFGGYDTSFSGTYGNDVWVLNNANGLGGTPAWTQLVPVGGPPSPRASHSAVYDSANNRMIVFGGNIPSFMNDVWVLENANGQGGTPAWSQLSPVGGPPTARASHTAVYEFPQ